MSAGEGTPSLSHLEKDLQSVIDTLSKITVSGASDHTQHSCKQFEKELRQKMRFLRRWRNGTETCNCADTNEMNRFIARSRRLTLDKRMEVLHEKLRNIEDSTETDKRDSVLTELGHNIGDNFLTVQETLHKFGNELMSKADFDRHARDIAEMENDLRILQDRLQVKKTGGFKSIFSKRKIRMPSKRQPSSSHKVHRIEDHPLANNVLRNAGKIRRMMEAFKLGGHVDITNGNNTASQCMENDLEVLRRQLRKVQQWQQCLQPFSTAEIDDLELIVSAIERHIRSDVDLDAPVKRRGSVIYLSTSSEDTTSRTSEISDEASYSQPPSVAQGAPPAYDDTLFIVDVKGHEENNNCLDGSCPEDSIIDERLI